MLLQEHSKQSMHEAEPLCGSLCVLPAYTVPKGTIVSPSSPFPDVASAQSTCCSPTPALEAPTFFLYHERIGFFLFKGTAPCPLWPVLHASHQDPLESGVQSVLVLSFSLFYQADRRGPGEREDEWSPTGPPGLWPPDFSQSP